MSKGANRRNTATKTKAIGDTRLGLGWKESRRDRGADGADGRPAESSRSPWEISAAMAAADTAGKFMAEKVLQPSTLSLSLSLLPFFMFFSLTPLSTISF